MASLSLASAHFPSNAPPVWYPSNDTHNLYEGDFKAISPVPYKIPKSVKCVKNPGELCTHMRCTTLAEGRKTFSFYVARKLDFKEDNSVDENNNHKTNDEIQKNLSIIDLLTNFPTVQALNTVNNIFTNNSYNDVDESSNCLYLCDNKYQYRESSDSIVDLVDKLHESSAFKRQKVIRHSDCNLCRFDLLYGLNRRGCSGILSGILSHLEDEELRQAKNVCKEWREIIFSDKRARERLLAYIENKKDLSTGSQKENKLGKRTPERSHKSVFLALTNSPVEVSPQHSRLSQSPARFDCFIEEAQKLKKDEMMMKCPKCGYPSRAESGNKHCCSRTLCQYTFCGTCLSPRQDNHLCSLPKLNDALPNIVGSKQSKKNLRRL